MRLCLMSLERVSRWTHQVVLVAHVGPLEGVGRGQLAGLVAGVVDSKDLFAKGG